MRFACAALAFLIGATARLPAQETIERLNLALPTDNDALFHGGGAKFYQYIIRDYKGVITKPWQGGQYGFVRDPVETPAGLVYTRFHEGIDIRPVRRDATGEPLDEVRAIADGTVVYTNLVAAHSNYELRRGRASLGWCELLQPLRTSRLRRRGARRESAAWHAARHHGLHRRRTGS